MTVENESGQEIMKRTLVCKNRVLDVFMDEIHFDDKSSIKDYIVVSPRHSAANLVTGTAVLPIYKGAIGLLKIHRHAVSASSWEIPRGFIDDRESAVVSAMRELEEETGLTCKEESMRSLGLIAPDAGILAARIHLFAALECEISRPFTSNEPGHRELRFYSTNEMYDMASSSEIQDPSTLVAYYKYKCQSAG
ncbi:MAG: NUDIX hydrolase [Nitrospinota bacterium]